MIVTFVAQCEKKALPKTRRVLDAFANRIGSRTWQTVITAEGLKAVKLLLRKTASKSTAVSCHWTRSRSRVELVWIVGNQRKFNSEGFVPVNFTESDTEKFKDKHQWKTLELIKYAASIAGLFHDFGKANKLFQNKLNPNIKSLSFEPYRHEWVSLRLFRAFVGDLDDRQWLEKLTDFNPGEIQKCFRDGIDDSKKGKILISDLDPFAGLVAWIIVSHHRLPLVPAWMKDINSSAPIEYADAWLDENFCAIWNSYGCKAPDPENRVELNWAFEPKALPYWSSHWRARACNLAAESLGALSPWLDRKDQDFINDNLFTAHLSRLAMILADHHYSSMSLTSAKWRNQSYEVFANTYPETKQFKQQLDEHLIGVSHHAERIVKGLLRFRTSLSCLNHNAFLTDSVPKPLKLRFGWQDGAVKAAQSIAKDTRTRGFFGINMASTGTGKTIANAKIMYALGEATDGVRFNVALGLRTLTLQTAREFRDSIQLSDEQLAVLIGGSAVKDLFEKTESQKSETSCDGDIFHAQNAPGSESAEQITDRELFVHYTGTTTQHSLSEWTRDDQRLQKMLCAPVMVSTIDHLMPATEGTRGGRQIGPMLRLLSSDLVLDEPDDFGLEDLPALCRLVHWTGMLGSRVLLSTATMPPALANALFRAYKEGWSQYAKDNLDGSNVVLACAWFDENRKPQIEHIVEDEEFKTAHRKFINKRLKDLKKQIPARRKGQIVNITPLDDGPIAALATTIHGQFLNLHQNHHACNGGHKVSIGLVRMANINPLVAVAKQLLLKDAPDGCAVHYCVYHSRYPLALRSHIESNLDQLLQRHEPKRLWEHTQISSCIAKYPNVKNHIFVVIASPVAEVGRDHDYDWAIVEPSSMRSIIQLAGRILRHRVPKEALESPNVLLLNKNYLALKKAKVCFTRPGFESCELRLVAHPLAETLLSEHFETIDASARIKWPSACEGGKENPTSFTRLNDLEHRALHRTLIRQKKGADVWWTSTPQWSGEIQRQQPFRKSAKDEAYFLFIEDDDRRPQWKWLNENVYPAKLGEPTEISIATAPELEFGAYSGFWFEQDADFVYRQLASLFQCSLHEVSRRFGELRITDYKSSAIEQYCYSDYLGAFKEINDQ